MPLAVVLTLAWGALAFGSVYPWAFVPLAVASGTVGVAGLIRGARPLPVLTLGGLAVVGVAAMLQTVPLPQRVLAVVSPASEALVGNYDVSYALAPEGPHARALSIDPSRTWLALGLLAAFGLLLAGVARSATRSFVRPLATGIVVLGVVMALIGIVQRAAGTSDIYGFWTPRMGRTPFGSFVNRNHFAGWMLMAIPVGFGLFGAMLQRAPAEARSWRERMLWLATPDANRLLLLAFALFVMLLSLTLTLSRSGIAAMGVAILLSAAVALRQSTMGRRMVGFAYALLVGLAVVSWTGLDAIAARFGAADGASLQSRLPIWQDTLRIAGDFWATGTGLNTYGISTLFYQTVLPDAHLREAHNDYLQLAAEGGLLLGIPAIVALALFAVEAWRRFTVPPGSAAWIRAGAITGIVAVALQSLVDFPLQMPGNAALFAVLCGLAVHDAPAGQPPPGAAHPRRPA
ncbi:MAG: O-antigen ligase family protein [Acidimicrobiia bacterium]|nr:O-antigen ligase family protein [Acidimicrobiia bacterium]